MLKPRSLQSQENKLRAVQMRRAGYTYPAIGKALGFSTQYAHEIVTKEILARAKECAEETDMLRELQNSRFEYIIQRLWVHALPNHKVKVPGPGKEKVEVMAPADLDQLSQLRQVMVNQAKLLGIDAPERITVEFQRDVEEFATRLGQLALRFIPEEMRDRYAEELRVIMQEVQSDGSENGQEYPRHDRSDANEARQQVHDRPDDAGSG